MLEPAQHNTTVKRNNKASLPGRFFFGRAGQDLFFQGKLKVNPPNDVYEQEADKIAEQVVSKPVVEASVAPVTISNISTQPIQRDDDGPREDEQEPLTGGLSTVADNLSENNAQFTPFLDSLKLRFWTQQPSALRNSIVGFGIADAILVGSVFALDPGFRGNAIRALDGINLMTPIHLIPHSDLFTPSSFTYHLPAAGHPSYEFNGEFDLTPYFDLLHEHNAAFPRISPRFGLNLDYNPATQSLRVVGGTFNLDLFNHAIVLGAGINQFYSPGPQMFTPAGATDNPVTLMQSLPAEQIRDTRFNITIDVPRLINVIRGVRDTPVQRKDKNRANAEAIVNEQAGKNDASLSSVEQTIASTGHPLDTDTRSSMEETFGQDFSNVQIHNDASAHQSAEAINALAYTHQNHIAFGQGQYQPVTDAGKKLLAHELTHVVQQASTVSRKNSIQRQATLPTDLSGYPPTDRKRIQVSTIRVDSTSLPAYNSIFATTPAAAGGATTSIPPNGTVVFNGTVPTTATVPIMDVRRGLRSIAGQLENSTNILPLNSTVTIALEIAAYGGANGNYRFTYFEHGTGANVSEVTLIEQLGTTTTIPTVATPAAAATAGSFTVGGQSFTLAGGWTQQQQAYLLQALNMMSAVALTQLTGATFARGVAVGTEAGSYNDSTHTITIRDNAFTVGLNRYAGGAEPVRIIFHEIGHALDYLPLRNAWTGYQGSGAEGPLTGARSLSGQRYSRGQGSPDFSITEGATSTNFRTAVIQDRTQAGVTLPTSITTYGSTNWEESFAEAYALYMSDRTLFQTLRPATYAYFNHRYP